MSYITIVKPNDFFCGKSFYLGSDGKINKGSTKVTGKAHAFTVPCNTLDQLADIINGLSSGDAIILGYVKETIELGGTGFALYSERALSKLVQSVKTDTIIEGESNSGSEPVPLMVTHNGKYFLQRKKKLFTRAPFICFDRDVDENVPDHIKKVQELSNPDFLKLLCSGISDDVSRAFYGADFLPVVSSSGQVFTKDGTPYTRDPSAHLYFKVDTPEDIDRFSIALMAHTMGAGYTYNKAINRKDDVKAYRRCSIFDTSVFTIGRLFFESEPQLDSNLVLHREPCKVVEVGGHILSTHDVRDPNADLIEKLKSFDISFMKGRSGNYFDSDTLSLDMTVLTKKGPMSIQQFKDSGITKLRCQTPFRDSSSWAAYLNRHDDGSVFLWDEGSHTKYQLPPVQVEYDSQAENLLKSALNLNVQKLNQNTSAAVEMIAFAEECEELEIVPDPVVSAPDPEPINMTEDTSFIDDYMQAKQIRPEVNSIELMEHAMNVVPINQSSDIIAQLSDVAASVPPPAPFEHGMTDSWGDWDECEVPFLIEDYFPQVSFGLIYGPPGSYKSFVALDIAAKIALNQPRWTESRLAESGAVMYYSSEGKQGLKNRLNAWRLHHDIESINGKGLYQDSRIIDLRDSLITARNVIKQAKAIEAQRGRPVRMVIFDTLARGFGDGDENSSNDMQAFCTACEFIRDELQCCVLVVHHSQKKGGGKYNPEELTPRGSGALTGAVDFEYLVYKDVVHDNTVNFRSRKMKDAKAPDDKMLRVVEVDFGIRDRWDRPVTGAVIDGEGWGGLAGDAQMKSQIVKESEEDKTLYNELKAILVTDKNISAPRAAKWTEVRAKLNQIMSINHGQSELSSVAARKRLDQYHDFHFVDQGERKTALVYFQKVSN